MDGSDEPVGLRLTPNPTSEGATIWFRLDRGGPVTLAIFDVAGRKVRTLQPGHMAAGEHLLAWDGRTDQGHEVAPGVYVARLTAPSLSQGTKIIRLGQ
jgi:flagellar hook assembly protein FlgD